jgi:hypothetical protein
MTLIARECLPAPTTDAAASILPVHWRSRGIHCFDGSFSPDLQDNKGYLIPWLVMIAIVTMFEVCLAGYLLSETVRNTVRKKNNSPHVYCYMMTVPVSLLNRIRWEVQCFISLIKDCCVRKSKRKIDE